MVINGNQWYFMYGGVDCVHGIDHGRKCDGIRLVEDIPRAFCEELALCVEGERVVAFSECGVVEFS